VHAVRAELVSLGRLCPTTSADQPVEIRQRLPIHAVPPDVARPDPLGTLTVQGKVRRPGRVTDAQLRALPRARLEPACQISYGPQ